MPPNQTVLTLVWLSCATVFAVPRPAFGQNAAVSGRVTNADDGQAIPGANVVMLTTDSTWVGTATNVSGDYGIAGLAAGAYVLSVSFVGYATTRDSVHLDDQRVTRVNIALKPGLIFDDEIVVTSVSRRPEKAVSAPAGVATLEAREVAARPVLSIGDHVKSLPAVDAATTGLMQTRLAVRGFNNVIDNSDRLLMLSDYRNTRFPSVRLNMAQLMPLINEDIERIEVVRGPGSALYGPNAANGVMNIITRTPFSSGGTDVMFGVGEQNLIMGSLRHAGVIRDKLGYKISARYFQGDDWEYTDPAEPQPRDSDITNGAVDARLDYAVADDFTINASGGWAKTTSINLTVAGAAHYVDAIQAYARTRFSYKDLFAQAFWNVGNMDKGVLLRSGTPLVEKSSLAVAQLQHSSALAKGRYQFTYGLDAFFTRPRTDSTIHGRYEDADDVNEVGGYLQSETQITPVLDLVVALRADKHSRIDNVIFSPRAALVATPIAGHTVRATYNRAYTTPSATSMFVDINLAPSLGPLPYPIQGFATPVGGYSYRRDTGGGVDDLYMQSPFNLGGAEAFIPAAATQMWPALVEILESQGVDISAVPAPTQEDVATTLAVLNTGTGIFEPVDPGDVQNLLPAAATITNTLELGYKGAISRKIFVTAEGYYTRIQDMLSSLGTITPNVFLDESSLINYLSGFMPPEDAAGLAVGMSEIPLGTVIPEEAGAVYPGAIIAAYENYDDAISVWGADLSLGYILEPSWTIRANYSFISEDLFPSKGNRKEDIALNAPKHKAGGSIAYFDHDAGFEAQARLRYVGGFPMIAGVYEGDVDPYTVLDFNASWAMPSTPRTTLRVSVQNLLDNKHREFVGAPEIGRLAIVQLQTHF